MVRRTEGSTDNILEIRVLASLDTLFHSGLGKSNCPVLIRFFMPGEIACPWLLKKGGNPHNLEQKLNIKVSKSSQCCKTDIYTGAYLRIYQREKYQTSIKQILKLEL